jgi:hypothetical protein
MQEIANADDNAHLRRKSGKGLALELDADRKPVEK